MMRIKTFGLFVLFSSLVILACNLGTVLPAATQVPGLATVPVPTATLQLQPTQVAANPSPSPSLTASTPPETSLLILTPGASPTPESSPTPAEVSPEALLEWEGFGLWGDGDDTRCKEMQIGSDLSLEAGFCESPPSGPGSAGQQFSEMVVRFAPFEIVTVNEYLVFRGQGEIAGDAWQRAILSWAHWTYAEVTTGHACASCRTVLSWDFGPAPGQPELCAQLTVLDYGYGYVEILPCTGGEVISYMSGWLETAEWEPFEAWLTDRGAVFEGNNYFSGTGANPMNAGELEELKSWATAVFNRLSQAGEIGSGQEN